jgi:hypothetical protein
VVTRMRVESITVLHHVYARRRDLIVGTPASLE